jgi:2-iminobutanoate/2-iminopropanoate deaminase
MKRFAIPLLFGILAGSVSTCAPPTPPPASHPQAEFITSPVTEGLDLPFSEAVRIGDLIILSGMVGIRPGTMQLVPGGLEPEARQALENIRTVLAASGASPGDVVKCTVMLDDIGEWGVFNQVYTEFFGDHRPARSAFGADGLAVGAAVELECMALAPPGAAGADGQS